MNGAAWPIAFAIILSIFDVFVMTILKLIHTEQLAFSVWTLALPVILYGATPLVFLYALRYEGIAIMNAFWDVISSVFIAILGVYFFKEELNEKKRIGILVSIVALFLLSD